MTFFPARRSAVFSDCRKFRYELRREWDPKKPPFVIGMLNPSVADEETDDPTARRIVQFAIKYNCGSMIVWNLGAAVSTDPKMWMGLPDPIGPENDKHIARILKECVERKGVAVVGWGTKGGFMDRDRAVLKIAKRVGVQLYCLRRTKDGHPEHPLYIPSTAQLIEVD